MKSEPFGPSYERHIPYKNEHRQYNERTICSLIFGGQDKNDGVCNLVYSFTKTNWFTFRGSNSAIFIFVSFLNVVDSFLR